MTSGEQVVSCVSFRYGLTMPRPRPLPPLEELRRLYELRDGVLVRRVNRSSFKAGTMPGHRGADGYWFMKINDKTYSLHRIVWAIANGQDPGEMQIDHIDGDRCNNRPDNLRLATPSQNAANRPAKGYHRVGNGYQARIQQEHIGYFLSEEAAAEAYRAERIRRFGEYAHVG
jgi:hypothetical protein